MPRFHTNDMTDAVPKAAAAAVRVAAPSLREPALVAAGRHPRSDAARRRRSLVISLHPSADAWPRLISRQGWRPPLGECGATKNILVFAIAQMTATDLAARATGPESPRLCAAPEALPRPRQPATRAAVAAASGPPPQSKFLARRNVDQTLRQLPHRQVDRLL